MLQLDRGSYGFDVRYKQRLSRRSWRVRLSRNLFSPTVRLLRGGWRLHGRSRSHRSSGHLRGSSILRQQSGRVRNELLQFQSCVYVQRGRQFTAVQGNARGGWQSSHRSGERWVLLLWCDARRRISCLWWRRQSSLFRPRSDPGGSRYVLSKSVDVLHDGSVTSRDGLSGVARRYCWNASSRNPLLPRSLPPLQLRLPLRRWRSMPPRPRPPRRLLGRASAILSLYAENLDARQLGLVYGRMSHHDVRRLVVGSEYEREASLWRMLCGDPVGGDRYRKECG